MRSHIKGAADHLRNESAPLRERSPEQILYHRYVTAGSPHGPVIYAVKGEHWNGVCPDFLEFLNSFSFDREDMGYAECGYGIQRHRDVMRKLIVEEHHLTGRQPGGGLEIDVGCLSMTTRMAMYDLAKVAMRHFRKRAAGGRPAALVPTPGWDYRGIFRDVGFDIVYLPIRPGNGWLPDLEEWSSIVRKARERDGRRVALAVSNPQHNPTGMQWPADVTTHLLHLCAAESGYLLVDDAYYAVHDPRVPLVNGLKTVLDAFDRNGGDNALTRSGMFDRWVATRPFGKQFSCNTMGVAAITASPRLLRDLGRESWINRYHCNTHNAEVMCAWLKTAEAARWTLETGMFYARQKERVRQYLVDRMGWPSSSVCVGPSTSYMIFEVPAVYHSIPQGIDRFRDDLFYATGTMICASLFNQAAPAPYVRLHLGSHYDIIDEILRRWIVAGLRYDQPAPFPGPAALTRPIARPEFRRQQEGRTVDEHVPLQ
ncbi:aminotransferase [Micromonospora deserti]|uniref:Aminotransferase n=2 Tax=Micromonospora deserti TaxID=2070366 RepID=A0A2W2BX43_9ACTN|nr:aminotransferase [Micromonospora deserti]